MTVIPQTQKEWEDQVLKEYVEYENPEVTSDIDVVWAISGYGVYDESAEAFNPEPSDNQLYRVDDREGTEVGINVVTKVTALRMGKDISDITKEDIEKNGPIFFYNGTQIQNEALNKAVSSSDFPLPSSRVRIDKLSETEDPMDANTRTQFERFPQEFLEQAIKKGGKIALIQSRWHLPRIARTINSKTVLEKQPLWRDVKIVYFVPALDINLPIDSKVVMKNREDLLKTIAEEGDKISTYSKKGDTNTVPKYS